VAIGQLETLGSDAKTSRKPPPANGRTIARLPFVDEVIQ
jgi:hypothetical protein